MQRTLSHNSLNPAFAKKEFESMHEKIDRMAGYLSKLTACTHINVEPSPEQQWNQMQL